MVKKQSALLWKSILDKQPFHYLFRQPDIVEDFPDAVQGLGSKKDGSCFDAPICCACPNPVLKVCGKCRSAGYCSVECQRKDWPFHKEKCKVVEVTLDGDYDPFKSFVFDSKITKIMIRGSVSEIVRWYSILMVLFYLRDKGVDLALNLWINGAVTQTQAKTLTAILEFCALEKTHSNFKIVGEKAIEKIESNINSLKSVTKFNSNMPLIPFGFKNETFAILFKADDFKKANLNQVSSLMKTLNVPQNDITGGLFFYHRSKLMELAKIISELSVTFSEIKTF